MSGEAKQQEIKETRVTSRVQNLTDTASFNAFVVVTLSNGQEASTQLTYRHGIDENAYFEDFQKWYRILDRIAQDGGDKPYARFHNGGKASAPASPEQPIKPSDAEKPKRNYKDPISQAELPAELAETNEDVFAAEFDAFKILPQPDNKSTVEFWKDGLDFPVGAKMNKWKHDTIINALAKLTEQEIDPAKAAEYRIAGVQYWVKGNEFTITQGAKKGEKSHYKNLVLLKPAF